MTDKKITEIGWNFDNSYSRLPNKFYSTLKPETVRFPKIAVINEALADNLGLNSQELQSEEGTAIFSGNKLPDGAYPLAQAYAGHQFGHFNMLGDGRALLLGEQINLKGERYDIQLKGSGRTPYSRGGDGKAALGPMLREYIISEAMHALGIPTTRSLAVVTTGEPVYRENVLPGAVLTRIARSHLRVATFQYAAHYCTLEELRALADYAIDRHFPECRDAEEKYFYLLREVIKGQAELIAKWQLVGFIHGVMNTDNITISGETIDYGPCAFMDTYDPATVFSSIDREGRYSYGNQPYIGGWNLARFAETLIPLLHDNEEEAVKIAQKAIEEYSSLYHESWLKGMRAKLGLFNEEPEDESLIEDMLKIMHEHRADFTNTFRSLTLEKYSDMNLFGTEEFEKWYNRWQERLKKQQKSEKCIKQLMRNTNPSVIPRNHRVEEALEAASKKSDYSVMERLLQVLSMPYAYIAEQEEYTKLPLPSNRPYRTFCGT